MSSPYREGPSFDARCPSCAGEVPSQVRACGRCHAEQPRVRCASCFWLCRLGAGGCERCGTALELEAELFTVRSLCPRCKGPLSSLDTPLGPALDCASCGGMFVAHDVMASLVQAHRQVVPPSIRPGPMPPDVVSYLPCPQCGERMNRAVFGRRSGIIVDTCKVHGTWFDPGELTGVLAFVEKGGLDVAMAREKEARERAARQMEIDLRVSRIEDSASSGRTFRHTFASGPASTDALVDLLDILSRLM